MKKRILIIASLVLVLGLAIAAVAFNQASTAVERSAMECCCKGDSCPMMKKHEHSEKKHEHSEKKMDCCKSGDSCPMKGKAANGDAKTCDCECCAK